MPISDLSGAELIGTSLAFLLTLMTLSYFLGDNLLFRLAAHLFVGAAAGYAGAVAWSGVLRPRLVAPLLSGGVAGDPLILAPVLLAVLMLFKLSPSLARYGNISMGFLVGVGAAVAVGGAVTGTLLPQMQTTMDLSGARTTEILAGAPASVIAVERVFDGVVILLGTIATLVYFHFGARPGPVTPAARPALIAPVAAAGQVFIAITFGAMFAGAMAASVAILGDRLQFLWSFLDQVLRVIVLPQGAP